MHDYESSSAYNISTGKLLPGFVGITIFFLFRFLLMFTILYGLVVVMIISALFVT